jgi:hypothetical protein
MMNNFCCNWPKNRWHFSTAMDFGLPVKNCSFQLVFYRFECDVASRLASSDVTIPSDKALPLYPTEGWHEQWRNWHPHGLLPSSREMLASRPESILPLVQCVRHFAHCVPDRRFLSIGWGRLKRINYVVNSSSRNTFI